MSDRHRRRMVGIVGFCRRRPAGRSAHLPAGQPRRQRRRHGRSEPSARTRLTGTRKRSAITTPRWQRTITLLGLTAGLISTSTPILARLGSDSFEVLLTDPGVVQFGVYDVDGSISYIDNFFGVDFIPADPGLADLGASVAADSIGGLSF